MNSKMKAITQSLDRSELAWLLPLKHTGWCYLISYINNYVADEGV